MSLNWYGRGRDIDPFFGLSNVLGDYDRQFRRMSRDMNRLENQFLGGLAAPDLNMLNYSVPELVSLTDRNLISPPRIIDQEGKKLAQYNFDVQGFRPEDINVKTTADGRLVVSAKHEDKGDDYHSFREFRRMVTIPEGMKVEEMKSRLENGVLCISAPLSAPALESKQQQQFVKELPIQHEKKSIQQGGQQQQSQPQPA
jgi:HSP20 family molecular chaperone IbpA